MKTRTEKNLRQANTGPASIAQQRRSSKTSDDSALQRRIGDSAAMQLQRAQIEKSFGPTAQRAVEDEELLQGRFVAHQLQGKLDEEELMQGKFDGPLQKQALEEEELLQGRLSEPVQHEQENTVAPNQTGMPDKLKDGIESLAGMDVSDLRVHYNSPKPAQLNAHAYAQGSDIHLGPGQEKHLPHEAWHTVQQREGRVQPTTQMADKQINDDPGLEHEADVMGARALNTKN